MSPPVFAVVWVWAWVVAWWFTRPRFYVESDAERWYVHQTPGSRHLAPVFATAFALTADVAWAVLP